MAGAAIAINVEIDDREVIAALRRLQAAGADMEPVFRSIGERLLINTRARFDREESPEGTAWAPLAEATLRRKMLRGVRRGKDQKRKSLTGRDGSTKPNAIRALAGAQILVERGYLHDTLRYQASASGVELGTDRIYGATHQFGRGHIPARPFLGLSSGDRQDILSIVSDHLRRALGSQ